MRHPPPILTDLDAQTGSTVWQQNLEPSGTAGGLAAPLNGGLSSVRPNGDLVIAGQAGAGSYSATNYPDVVGNMVSLVNGATGQIMPIPIPPVTWNFNCGLPQGFNPNSPGDSNIISMATDSAGNTYVEYNHEDQSTLILDSCTGFNYETEGKTSSVRLLTIGVGGSSSDQELATSSISATCQNGAPPLYPAMFADSVVPDGEGGVLATWVKGPAFGWTPPCDGNLTRYPDGAVSVQVTHISASGSATYELPLMEDITASFGPPYRTHIVIGDNGTAFATNGVEIVSFNVDSGAINWTYQSSAALSLLVSSSGGGVTAKAVTAGDVETVLRFDASGNVTMDNWTGSGIINYGGSLWFGYSNNDLGAYSAAPVELSAASWYAPDGNGGNAAIQDISVPDFSQSVPNQTTIGGVMQKIINALPSYSVCNNWLQGAGSGQGISGQTQLQTVLQNNNFGHGTIHFGNGTTQLGNIDYDIDAFSGNKNQDGTTIYGVPLYSVFVVNDAAGFFNQFVGGGQSEAFSQGPRHYPGGSLRAQASILIHETAHQITVSGFQPDANNKKAEKANQKAVDLNCRSLIEGIQ